METENARKYGALSGVFLMLAAMGGNWLITPMAHPDASSMLRVGVVAQVVVGLAVAVWCWRLAGRGAKKAGLAS